MKIFTDGACSSNGRANAKASWAVWFPEQPDWSVAERVPAEEQQSNNRGELLAIAHAFRILLEKGVDQPIEVYSDSEYSINCLTKWVNGWKAKGWKTAAGKPVSHRDLIEEITTAMTKCRQVRFIHVRAHTGGDDELSRNNAIVDKMANEVV